jgi:uncharacterized membrane protein YvlD (DUF360 family)
MGDVLISCLILACSFWFTAQVLGGVQLQGLKETVMAVLLFGGVNALLGWFLTGVVVIVPLGATYLVLLGTRWVVNALLLVLLDTSTRILILKNSAAALVAGLVMTAIGTTAEYLLLSHS